MKKVLFIFGIFVLISCTSRKENKTTAQNNTPQALQDNKESSLTDFKKRGTDDLVEELYEEAIEKSSVLAALEKKFPQLNEIKNDSLRVFEKYKDKNEDYYASATRQLNSIQDSLLKKEIGAVFEKDKAGYTTIISRLNELENELGKQSIYSADHRVVLKLFITLNMMKQYRKNNTPSSMLLGSVLNEYKALNQKLDSAINKNK